MKLDKNSEEINNLLQLITHVRLAENRMYHHCIKECSDLNTPYLSKEEKNKLKICYKKGKQILIQSFEPYRNISGFSLSKNDSEI